MCFLCVLNFMQSAIEQGASIPGLHVGLSRKGCSIQLNGFFTTVASVKYSKKKTIMQRIWYLQIIGACTDRVAVLQNKANMTGVHCKKFKRVSKVVSKNYC